MDKNKRLKTDVKRLKMEHIPQKTQIKAKKNTAFCYKSSIFVH